MKCWAVVLIVLCGALAAYPQSADESKILALENVWNNAQREHDAKALEAMFADTFIDTEADGKVMNRAQYLASVKDPNLQHQILVNTEMKVFFYGQTAIVLATYHDKGTENGKPFDMMGRFTDTWINSNGKWLCVSTALTPIHAK